MATQKLPSQQRISKSTGRVMLGIAIIFDLIPVLLLMLVGVFVIYQLGDSFASDAADVALGNQIIEDNSGDNFLGAEILLGGASVAMGGAISAGAKVALGAAGLIFIGPIIYTFGSYIATALAYVVFAIWFYLKGVNILSFGNSERVLVNLMSVVIEYIPLLNLLPSITFGVWRHIKVSRAEDAIKDSELLSKASKTISRVAYA